MIKTLIAWGFGFTSGTKYIVTRGLGVGAPPTVPATEDRLVVGRLQRDVSVGSGMGVS